LRNCWGLSRYTIPVMVMSMKKKGPYTLSLLRVQKHVHLCAAPDPAVVGIDLATYMKHAIITKNYGVHVHHTCSVLLHDSSEHCMCPLYKFVYSFTFVKLFLKHPVLQIHILLEMLKI
jgi:hypothetical protein